MIVWGVQMIINATAANRVAYTMNNNWTTNQFQENDSRPIVLIINSIMEKISRAALRGEYEIEIAWTGVDKEMFNKIQNYLASELGYNVIVYGGANDGFVIKW
nr:MAG TPA: hypothetical protein [Caudoviricetes sp.]